MIPVSAAGGTAHISLRVLLIEDSEIDAELVLEELRAGGYRPIWERVDTADTLTAALTRQEWDLITCDWVMPQFGALSALAILHDRRVDVPIIVVTGEVGEEFAVTAMKAGAHDFVSKYRLARLVPAVERELRDAKVARAREQAEQELYLTQFAMDRIGDAILWIDAAGRIVYVNDTASRRLGYTHEQLLAMHIWDVDPDPTAGQWSERWQALKASGTIAFETRHRHCNGSTIAVEVVASYLHHGNREYCCGVCRDITDRKRAEQAVADALKYNQTLFEASPIGILTCKASGKVVSANEACARLTGGTVEQVTALNFRQLASWQNSGLLAAADAALASGEEQQLETALMSTFGKSLWLTARFVPFQFAGEMRLLGLFTDVTARKQAEAALQASEDRYRDLVEHSQDLICTHTLDGRILSVNSAAVRTLGYEVSELLRRNMRDFLAPEFQAGLDEYLATIKRQGFATGLLRVQTKAGEFRIWEYSNTLRTEGVAAPIVRGMAHDITERWQAERALRRSEQRFRSLIEKSRDLIAIIDGNGVYRYVNPAHEEATGSKPEELVGTSALDLLHPDDARVLAPRLAEAVQTNVQSATVEYRLRHKNGTWRHIEGIAINFFDDPSVAGILITGRDITERRSG